MRRELRDGFEGVSDEGLNPLAGEYLRELGAVLKMHLPQSASDRAENWRRECGFLLGLIEKELSSSSCGGANGGDGFDGLVELRVAANALVLFGREECMMWIAGIQEALGEPPHQGGVSEEGRTRMNGLLQEIQTVLESVG